MPEALVAMSVPLLRILTVGQTESWQAGSAYRIQPIQERAKRPLWTINNSTSGFVSCLWEQRKRMTEHVMKSGRGVVDVEVDVEVDGLFFLISL